MVYFITASNGFNNCNEIINFKEMSFENKNHQSCHVMLNLNKAPTYVVHTAEWTLIELKVDLKKF